MNRTTVQVCLFSTIKAHRHGFGIQFTAIATSVIGLISSPGSILGNLLVLFVLIKNTRLQFPSNVLLGNLCVTDFMTGLIVVPTISVRRITEAYGKGICIVRVICAYFSYITVMVSIFTVGMISIDRYYAIMKPFTYQRTVNNKLYILIITFTWLMLGAYSSLPVLDIISGSMFFRIACALMTIAITVFAVCYARISRVVKAHRRKVWPKSKQTKTRSYLSERIASTKRFSHRFVSKQFPLQCQIREHQKANTVALVVCFAILCYGPLMIVFVLRGIMGDTFELVYLVDPWADLIMYLNSLINPLVYCLRACDIRQAIKRVVPSKLRKFFLTEHNGSLE